jgi:predicted Zn-dependent peptidase
MARMAHIGLAVIVAMSWGCGAARILTSPSPPAAVPTRHVLANGIPVIIQQHRGSDVVALQLWVRAGARDETAAELGLAHYL